MSQITDRRYYPATIQNGFAGQYVRPEFAEPLFLASYCQAQEAAEQSGYTHVLACYRYSEEADQWVLYDLDGDIVSTGGNRKIGHAGLDIWKS